MESDQDCFTNLCESFAWWDQGTLSLRTWQRCLLEGWTRFSDRLPRMGTMRNGKLYQRRAWVRRTDATECLSSDMLPTPIASESEKMSSGTLSRAVRPDLQFRISSWSREMWPTPSASNAKGASKKRFLGSPDYRSNLDEAVRTSESSGQLNPTWVDWLMGFPTGYTDLDASETQSSRKSRK